MTPIEKLTEEFQINLPVLADCLIDKEDFFKQCEIYIKTNPEIKPLTFCTHLKKNGFPLVARTICQYFIETQPGGLSKLLA